MFRELNVLQMKKKHAHYDNLFISLTTHVLQILTMLQNTETHCKSAQTTSKVFKGTTTSDVNVYSERGDFYFNILITLFLILSLDIISLNKLAKYIIIVCETLCKLANLYNLLKINQFLLF